MTKKEIYEKAMYTMAIRRQNSIDKSNFRKQEIYDNVPQVRNLETELARTAVKLSKTIFLGGADSAQIIEQIKTENLKLQTKISQLLEFSGYPENALDNRYECNNCSDTGFILGEACECLIDLMKKISFDEFNNYSDMPISNFADFSLKYYSKQSQANSNFSEHDIMSKILGFCSAYSNSFSKASPNILMLGNTGLGKTHLSRAIANEALNAGFSVLYGTSQEFFTQIQTEYFSRNNDNKDTYKDVISADLLIIDDLGAEYESAFNNTTCYNVINSRLNKNLPTIINTILSLQQIENRYSNRVASRLGASYKCLKFVGTDVRQQKLRFNDM